MRASAYSAIDDLEASILGGIIVRNELLASLTRLEVDDFYNHRHKVVFEAIRNLEARHSPIDVVLLESEIESYGKLDAVGGIAFLGELALRVPTPENIVQYAELVRDASLKRKLMLACDELQQAATDEDATGAEVLSKALAAFAKFDSEQPEDTLEIGAVVKQRLGQLDEIQKKRLAGEDAGTGYPTGIEKLDDVLGGIQPGIITIVAARPAMGKSSFARTVANATNAAGHGVHVFSLEDTRRSYADRAMAGESGVPVQAIRSGRLERGQMESLRATLPRLLNRKGWLFDDRSGITASEIIRSVRRHLKTNKTKVVVVDYIQLVRREADMRKANAHEVLTAHMIAFATAAKQDNIAYVVLSQLNRGLESRPDKRPMLADLRESGSLEEHAKTVIGLYRGCVYSEEPRKGIDYSPERYAPPTRAQFERMIQLIVLKNNDGEPGVVHAEFDGPLTRIS